MCILIISFLYVAVTHNSKSLVAARANGKKDRPAMLSGQASSFYVLGVKYLLARCSVVGAWVIFSGIRMFQARGATIDGSL